MAGKDEERRTTAKLSSSDKESDAEKMNEAFAMMNQEREAVKALSEVG